MKQVNKRKTLQDSITPKTYMEVKGIERSVELLPLEKPIPSKLAGRSIHSNESSNSSSLSSQRQSTVYDIDNLNQTKLKYSLDYILSILTQDRLDFIEHKFSNTVSDFTVT